MTIGDVSDRMMALAKTLEQRSRFALAWTIAADSIHRNMLFMPPEQAIERAFKEAVEKVKAAEDLARDVRKSRALKRLLDRMRRKEKRGRRK